MNSFNYAKVPKDNGLHYNQIKNGVDKSLRHFKNAFQEH